jgi:hypothetical protein
LAAPVLRDGGRGQLTPGRGAPTNASGPRTRTRGSYRPLVAYDDDLADRLRLLLIGHGLTEKKMFGALAFLLHGHMAVAVSGQGGIMVRVAPEQTDVLLHEPGTQPFEMRGRPMRGWLRVATPALHDDAVLRGWAERGLAYVRTLPPK